MLYCGARAGLLYHGGIGRGGFGGYVLQPIVEGVTTDNKGQDDQDVLALVQKRLYGRRYFPAMALYMFPSHIMEIWHKGMGRPERGTG